MGRIKELRQKLEDGVATDEEKQELSELEAEAADKVETPTESPAEPTEDLSPQEEKAVDKIVDAIMKSVEKVAPKEEKEVKVTRDPRFVMDKSLGRVTVEKLEEVMIKMPERKRAGKEVTEITGKDVHFLHALLTGDRQKLQVLTEGTAANGGYLVPEAFENMIVEDRRDMTVMRQIAEVIPVTTDTVHIPTLTTRPLAAWRSEGAVKATSTAQFSEIVLTPYSLAAIVPLTQELVDDATLGVNGSIVNKISQYLSQSIAEVEDKAFFTGSGTGRPTGISTYSINSINAGGTDATHADAIQQLFYRLPQGYRNRAVWVGHRAVWEKIATLKDSQNRYLLQSIADGPAQSLKGRPIYEQNDLPTSELYFGDFSLYVIADRQGVTVDQSSEATVGGQNAFERNLVFVRAEERVDGELTLTQGIRKITNF